MGGAEPIPYWPCFSFGFALLTPRAKTVRSAYYSSTLVAWRSRRTTAASFAMYFAQAALLKLAFIITQIREKGIDAGVLLELICNGRQAKFLIRWFRQKGFGLKVLAGDTKDLQGTARNGVGVFYKLARFKPVVGLPVQKYSKCVSDPSPNAASKIGERMLCLALRRSDMSVLNLVAWHGRHDEAGFRDQIDSIDDLAVAHSSSRGREQESVRSTSKRCNCSRQR